MAEATKQAVASTEKATNVEAADFELTKTGVMIIGSSLIGEKLTGLVIEMLKALPEAQLACIEFRNDNYPQDADGPVFAMAFADTHSFAVNLEHCWHRACVKAAKGEEPLGFLGMLWTNLLSAVGHELDHLMMAEMDRPEYEKLRGDEAGQKALEDSADETARQEILRLARLVDTEIPTPDQFGWFGTKIMALFTTDSTKDLDWVKKLQKDMESGIIYDEGENKTCDSFRQFVQLAHDPDKSTGNWDQAVQYVNLTAELENGETIEIKADAVPVVDVAEEIVQKEEPIEMVADHASGMFVGAGDGPEAETVIDQPEAPQPEAVVVGNPVEAAAAGMVAAVAGVQEVPLPETVIAEQANNVPPAPAAPATTYEPNNVDMSMMPAITEALWKTLYAHVYGKCGWQQNPQTGRFFFANPAAILEFVSIQHIIDHFGCQNFIMECDGQSAVGASLEGISCATGQVKGHISSKQGLPMYTIYLNINGQRIKRSFVPQNPEKMNAQNAYSNPALEAQRGHMIAWVYKGEGDGKPDFKDRCAAKIKDNAYEIIQ